MDSIVDRHSRETTRTPTHTPRRWRERGHRPKKKRSGTDTPWPLPNFRGKRIWTGGSVTSEVKIGIGTWARSDYRPSRSVPVGSAYLPTSLRTRTYVYPPPHTQAQRKYTRICSQHTRKRVADINSVECRAILPMYHPPQRPQAKRSCTIHDLRCIIRSISACFPSVS
jgi:hypothetical protein